MAEKVFHLLSELQKMDEWKAEFLERKRDTQDQVLRTRACTLTCTCTCTHTHTHDKHTTLTIPTTPKGDGDA